MGRSRIPKGELIKWVRDNWLKPWRKLKPAAWSFQDFYEAIFRINRRSIEPFRAKGATVVIGDILLDGFPVPGIRAVRERSVKENGIVWVRADKDEPFIEIETNHAVFRVKREEGLNFVERNFTSL